MYVFDISDFPGQDSLVSFIRNVESSLIRVFSIFFDLFEI